jgi:hypothetical protein
MISGALLGLSLAVALFLFEFVACKSASRQRARRRHLKNAELDQSEIARLRTVGSVRSCHFFAAVSDGCWRDRTHVLNKGAQAVRSPLDL